MAVIPDKDARCRRIEAIAPGPASAEPRAAWAAHAAGAGASPRASAAARTAREAAEAAYESRLAQLRAGHATTAELFAAEGQLNAARFAELDAAVQLQLARTQLDYAIGD